MSLPVVAPTTENPGRWTAGGRRRRSVDWWLPLTTLRRWLARTLVRLWLRLRPVRHRPERRRRRAPARGPHAPVSPRPPRDRRLPRRSGRDPRTRARKRHDPGIRRARDGDLRAAAAAAREVGLTLATTALN